MKPGDLFGPYRILRRIDGRSGYEEFLGLDRARFLYARLRVPVRLDDEEVRALLAAQAELRRHLSVKGLAELVDEGEVEGVPYLALGYGAGKSLDSMLPVEEGQVVDLARRMSDFLTAMAASGMLPWRLEARNWLLGRDGQLRLNEVVSPDPERALRGRPRWFELVPEHFLKGNPWDEACVVHALVMLLAELLLGEAVIRGHTITEVLAEHAALRDGEPVALLDGLPPGWAELVRSLFGEEAPRRLAELRPILEALCESSLLDGGDDRLAGLERADSQYWRALSLASEGRGEEALAELGTILRDCPEALASMGAGISALVESIHWTVSARRDGKGGSTAESFVDFLRAVLLLHRRCGAEHRARIVERHLLESILIEFGQDREAQEHQFRQALSLCSDPLVTKQEYARFLAYRGEREKARNVQIQLAGRYRARGHVEAALRELDRAREGVEGFRYVRLHGQIKRQAMHLEMEREDLTKCLGTVRDRDRRLDRARKFLERHPGDAVGMKLVLGEAEALGLEGREVAAIRWRLAVRLYETYAFDEASTEFRRILQDDPKREDALSYLADCLRRQGLRWTCRDRGEWVKALTDEVEKGGRG